ncbi:MAG: symmetrical bis(5'-nucleosyl)-tetraphosphatase [Burkholderiaceae bacterium]
MALYCIGDVQGCNAALGRLLAEIDFSPSRDTLYLLGDLVNRGPDNVGVLRRLMALGASARCLLGNHDLHLLAVAYGVRGQQPRDTLSDVLQAPDRPALIDWLRRQPLARLLTPPLGAAPTVRDAPPLPAVLLVHAGVLPSWTTAQTLALAAEVEAQLQGPAVGDFLNCMYGNNPDHWRSDLQGAERLRVIVNALTRLRFCSAGGVMDLKTKEGTGGAPPGMLPWFDVTGRATGADTVLFGHWSALGWFSRGDVLCLDTGCVWGGCLSAVRWLPQAAGAGSAADTTGKNASQWQRLQVPCKAEQAI